MSYKFVRVHRKGTEEYGIWYFKPRTIEDVELHWREVCAAEIRLGVQERFDASQVHDDGYVLFHHPTTQFGMGIEGYCCALNKSYIEGMIELENLAYKTRVESFIRGDDIYLTEGMTVYMMDDRFFEIAEEVEYDCFVYPAKKDWSIDDVRYMQWNMLGNVGTHWYAKIGKRDIYDSEGNMKWDTKEEAENAAEWYLYNKIKSK
jgi:hypothetical protein